MVDESYDNKPIELPTRLIVQQQPDRNYLFRFSPPIQIDGASRYVIKTNPRFGESLARRLGYDPSSNGSGMDLPDDGEQIIQSAINILRKHNKPDSETFEQAIQSLRDKKD